jgi:hypothetical protein
MVGYVTGIATVRINKPMVIRTKSREKPGLPFTYP